MNRTRAREIQTQTLYIIPIKLRGGGEIMGNILYVNNLVDFDRNYIKE